MYKILFYTFGYFIKGLQSYLLHMGKIYPYMKMYKILGTE